jgi:hypothetical protein
MKLAFLISLAAAASLTGSTDNTNQKFSLYGSPDPKVPGNVLITLHSESAGWAAFGIGAEMAGSSIIVGWKNSKGDIVVSDRYATGYRLPVYSASQTSKLVALAVPAPSWATLAFSVTRPFKTAEVEIAKSSEYIYAYSDSGPDKVDIASSAFSSHDDYAQLGAVDFTK